MSPKQPAMSPSGTPVEIVLGELPEARRDEAVQLMRLMSDVTGEPATVWASRIMGFGQYRYHHESGREGDAPLAAFATTQRHHTIYLIGDFAERHQQTISQLGTFTHGKSCLYVKRLADIDLDVLRILVDRSVRVSRGRNQDRAE